MPARNIWLITGVTGLAEFLLNMRYTVHGMKWRPSSFNAGRIDHLYHDPHEAGQRFGLRFRFTISVTWTAAPLTRSAVRRCDCAAWE
jgi:GDP-D-mannose dehydratase